MTSFVMNQFIVIDRPSNERTKDCHQKLKQSDPSSIAIRPSESRTCPFLAGFVTSLHGPEPSYGSRVQVGLT
jgi:hypothetical protein